MSRSGSLPFVGLLALGLLFTPVAATAAEPILVRIDATSPAAIAELEQAGFDIALEGKNAIEVLTDDSGIAWLTARGYRWERIERDLIPGARAPGREGNLDSQYHTYQEMVDQLAALQAQYPSICRMYDIGDALSKSYDWTNYSHDYDIWAVRISDNPGSDEPEPCIIYDARHHAREPVSTEIALAVAIYFCENYATDPLVRQAVDSSEIWCVPMLNPDGHQWVEDIDVWWRKNLHDADGDHHVDSYEGIDLNRNYDWHWFGGNWYEEVYGGPYPWAAPEIVSIRELHLAQRPAINPSYHSYGEVVLYPFGYGVMPEPAVLEIADEFGSYVGYSVEQSYNPAGTSKDWLYGTIGTVSFTVETATEFIPSGATMESVVEQVLPGSLWLTQRLWGASVQGRVTSALTGEPLLATIHIPEIHEVYGEGELLDILTEASTGYYCRMMPLAQQTITLEVSAEDHLPAIVEVVTGGYSATVRDIALQPDPSVVEDPPDALPASLIRFRNPYRAGEAIQVAGSPDLPGAVGPRALAIVDLQGREVRRFELVGAANRSGELRWDGRSSGGDRAPSGLYFLRIEGGEGERARAKLVLMP